MQKYSIKLKLAIPLYILPIKIYSSAEKKGDLEKILDSLTIRMQRVYGEIGFKVYDIKLIKKFTTKPYIYLSLDGKLTIENRENGENIDDLEKIFGLLTQGTFAEDLPLKEIRTIAWNIALENTKSFTEFLNMLDLTPAEAHEIAVEDPECNLIYNVALLRGIGKDDFTFRKHKQKIS